MRKSRFTDAQIVAILREADRTSVTEVAKKNEVSEQTWAAPDLSDGLRSCATNALASNGSAHAPR